MKDDVVFFECPCCSSLVLLHPGHPMYELALAKYLLELQREAHPEQGELELEDEGGGQ